MAGITLTTIRQALISVTVSLETLPTKREISSNTTTTNNNGNNNINHSNNKNNNNTKTGNNDNDKSFSKSNNDKVMIEVMFFSLKLF